jgi:hypothetical protein
LFLGLACFRECQWLFVRTLLLMKALLLGCSLVAALPATAQRLAPAKKVGIATHPSVDVYGSLLNLNRDTARLLRRAMAEPDDKKAIAMLNGQETAHLMKRAEALRPSLSSWVNTLSEAQKEQFMQRFMKESPLMQCIDSLEHNPQTKARVEHNPDLQNTIQTLTYYTL